MCTVFLCLIIVIICLRLWDKKDEWRETARDRERERERER